MVQICHLDTGWYDGDPGMTSDLWELRAWLTLKEAAGYLYFKAGLDVDESNILRLALDGKLQLSLNFLKPRLVKILERAAGQQFAPFQRLLESAIAVGCVFQIEELVVRSR